MTRPSLIVLMYDDLGASGIHPKIFVRTLLYSTGNQGHIVQSMYLKVRRGEASQNFSVWGHGPLNNLTYGAGLRVTPGGVDHNHHFNPPKGSSFEYFSGEYVIQIFAELAGSDKHLLLAETGIVLTDELAAKLKSPRGAIFFEWGPESRSYTAHFDERPAGLAPRSAGRNLLAVYESKEPN